MFLKIKDDYYDLNKAIKIVKSKDIYKITFDIKIKLGNNKYDTYIQKTVTNCQIPDSFIKIDENLYLNFDKIIKIKFFDNEDFVYLTSNTKKKIGKKYINYNIKVTGKNNKIKKIIEGGKMSNWKKIGNMYINLDNVTNIFLDKEKNKIIVNFINSASTTNNLDDVRPIYEYEIMTDKEIDNLIKDILKYKNWILIDNKLINKDNVYNIKVMPTDKNYIIFINFISNIVKVKDNEKIVSTEFHKTECKTKEEADKIVNYFIKG